MNDKYLQLISDFRDLGTKSQLIIEEYNQHERGINLKRDAAGHLIDFFLKYSDNNERLKSSLEFYADFSSFFIHARLEKLIDYISQEIRPYKNYVDNISEKFKELGYITELTESANRECFEILAFLNKDISECDLDEIAKIFESLKESTKTIERLELAKEMVNSNLSVMKTSKILVLSLKFRSWIFVTIAGALIATIIKSGKIFIA